MKKLILAALALTASTVYAGQVVVMNSKVPVYNDTHHRVSTRFYMDQQTGQGYVKASVSEQRITYRGRGDRNISYHEIFSETVKVDGLMLMGDQAVYHSPEGNVVCGTMSVSRVFKIPTLYLTGDCSLSSSLVKEGRNMRNLTVTLTTK